MQLNNKLATIEAIEVLELPKGFRYNLDVMSVLHEVQISPFPVFSFLERKNDTFYSSILKANNL